MFLGLSDLQQDSASEWLGSHTEYPELNLYYYQGEENTTWLFYALNRSDIKFLNLDSNYSIINVMSSYILGRPNVYYTTKDENLKALMSHINNQFVPDVNTFLEKVLNG